MKQAFKLTIVKQSIDGATIEYFLSSYAVQARIESLEAKGFIVVMTQVEYFNNSYVDVI